MVSAANLNSLVLSAVRIRPRSLGVFAKRSGRWVWTSHLSPLPGPAFASVNAFGRRMKGYCGPLVASSCSFSQLTNI